MKKLELKKIIKECTTELLRENAEVSNIISQLDGLNDKNLKQIQTYIGQILSDKSEKFKKEAISKLIKDLKIVIYDDGDESHIPNGNVRGILTYKGKSLYYEVPVKEYPELKVISHKSFGGKHYVLNDLNQVTAYHVKNKGNFKNLKDQVEFIKKSYKEFLGGFDVPVVVKAKGV